ncbi:hypothetical protein STANM309S_01471 [Streptomyces tanashiensis]
MFLEFALAGALPVKVLTGYGKELSARLAPMEAYERFRRLCVRRTAGGLAPSAQAAVELRRLARAADLSGNEADTTLANPCRCRRPCGPPPGGGSRTEGLWSRWPGASRPCGARCCR